MTLKERERESKLSLQIGRKALLVEQTKSPSYGAYKKKENNNYTKGQKPKFGSFSLHNMKSNNQILGGHHVGSNSQIQSKVIHMSNMKKDVD